ncbi:hypothetical protein [Castellaniella sp.]|uniref:hypothetical protein n=1 Tax=Castellaniella sp. TaxID=1955812 RepID=UPI002B003273|nr:hypothetical protein [Castellaniella sp.]
MSGKLELLLLHVLSALRTDVADYCDLETVDDDTIIVAQDGSSASIVQFHGVKSIVGRDDFEGMIESLTEGIATFFKQRGHAIQVVFTRDIDATDTLEETAAQQRATAARVGLDIDVLINESAQTYAKYVYEETCYFVLWSRPSLLDPVEQRMSANANNQFRKEANWPSTSDAQNLLRPISYLKDRHKSFVSKLVNELTSSAIGCSAEVLQVGEALRAVRASIYGEYTPKAWRPSIPGTAIPLRWKEDSADNDASGLLYPNLASQIMVAKAHEGSRSDQHLPDPTTVRIGSRVYAPLIVTIPPQEPQYFNSLFNALNRAETMENGQRRAIPYVISYMLESDGLSGLTPLIQAVFGGLLAFTSEQNRDINLSMKALKEQKRDGAAIAKLRIAAMTWAAYTDEGVNELALRKSKLWRTMNSWGQLEITERTGSPTRALQSCAVGLTPSHIGTPCPAPLDDAIALLPLARPASCFMRGSAIHRTLDGKILREERFSSEQTTWIKIVTGKPGSGKSVAMNNSHVEACLLPGATQLPYIGINDIGISSSGFIDMIRDGLPEHMKHLAIYKRVQNAAKDGINPLDTPLGQRRPLPGGREFARNFITMLVTPAERNGQPYTGMSSFVGRMIDLAHESRSDGTERGSPARYKQGQSEIVDRAVAQLGFHALPATSYWEITDLLFDAGLYYEAEVAQRYAVPTLNDLMAVASSTEIQDEYGQQIIEGGGSLLKAFVIGIREAISDFPIFSGPTQFDLGSARISALDLQDVTPKGSSAATKQTGLMFMAARESFMKKLAFSEEDLPFFTERTKPYFARLIADLVAQPKIFCMDELHRAGGQQLLEEQLLRDGREARKWKMEIILGSQLPEDFGAIMKMATSILILDAGTEATRKWVRENVGLSDVEEQALTRFVHGPNEHGTTYLAKFVTKDRTYGQLFTLNVGPQRLWALSTTAEDRDLRRMLYAAMPRPVALRLLAKRFPRGSCQKTLEKLKAQAAAEKDTDFVDDEVLQELVKGIGNELIAEYRRGEAEELEEAAI